MRRIIGVGIVAVVASWVGVASACPFGVEASSSCHAPAAQVVVSQPLVVSSVVPLTTLQTVAPSVVVASPVVASATVVVAAPVAAVAVRPTVMRQRVVVRNFGALRPRARW